MMRIKEKDLDNENLRLQLEILHYKNAPPVTIPIKSVDDIALGSSIFVENTPHVPKINDVVNIVPNIRQSAIDWVSKNLPAEHQSTKEYFDLYKNSIENPIIIQKFTKIVESFGYKRLHGKTNYWVKCT
jgi:hypothetical protein